MSFFKEIKHNFGKYQLALVIMFFAIFSLMFTRAYSDSTNNSSRFMTMQSIVEQGTLAINNQHFNTDDKILRDDNYYSSKPPVLSLAGAGVYYLLHNIFSLDITMPGYSWAIYFINLILISSSFFVLLFILYQTLKLLDTKKEYRLMLLLGFGLGTLFFSYFVSMNNHTVAGSMLFLGFYFLLKLKLNKSDNYKKYISLAGFFISLSAVIDMPVGLVFLGLFFVYCLILFPRKYIFYYFLSALPMLILQVVLNYQVTGDFLLPQFHPEYWDYTNNVANALGNSDIINDQSPFILRRGIGTYMFNILVGTHGLFLYTPLLLFSVYSIYKSLRDKANQFRLEAAVVALGFLLIFLFYALKIRVYTGAAYGYRWFIAITPLLYFFIIPLFQKKRSNIFWTIFLVAWFLSVGIAFIGFLSPWNRSIISFVSGGQVIQIEFPLLANLIALVDKF